MFSVWGYRKSGQVSVRVQGKAGIFKKKIIRMVTKSHENVKKVINILGCVRLDYSTCIVGNSPLTWTGF